MSELVEQLTSHQLPNNYLGVFSRARNKSIAFTNVNFSNIVLVSMQRSLQCKCVSVPHFEDSKTMVTLGVELTRRRHPRQ